MVDRGFDELYRTQWWPMIRLAQGLVDDVSSDAPAIPVLAITIEEVTAGHGPRAFRVRPAHAYLIACQITFRPGADGMGVYKVTTPQGMQSTGVGLSTR